MEIILKDMPKFKTEDYLREEYYHLIYPFIKGKSVLDVGCVDHDVTRANQEKFWSHLFLSEITKETVGIDIEEKSIEIMKKMGFKVYLMDAEKIKFERKFDVVFAGEVIEHLTNPGLFLQGASKVLKDSGKIIVTTPNTFSVNRFVRVLQHFKSDPVANSNPDHVAYFTPSYLTTLARKENLKVTKIAYSYFPSIEKSVLVFLNRIVCRILGSQFKELFIAIIEK